MQTKYNIPMPLSKIRLSISNMFRKYASIEDPRVVSMVLQRGHIEFDELVSHCKQNSHVLNQIHENLPSEKKQKTLLQMFLDGDELK
jgi:hypothetical protein